MDSVGNAEAGEKRAMIEGAMHEAGLTRCTLLEVWDEHRRNPPAPPPGLIR